MKVGILGGTFDPIHLGHLRAAENARETLGLEKIVFVPAGTPPHRKAPQASQLARFVMTALATAGHPAFVVSDAELKREGPSYTVDTVREWLRSNPEDAVHLIVGTDAFLEMSSWKEGDLLFELCAVAVAPRAEEGLEEPLGKRARLVRGPGLSVSSSEVRQRASSGQSVRYLVPDAVAEFIVKGGLYR